MATRTVPIIFVGGFLGAGKTTLLWAAAKLLIARGNRVGLITNDQARDLVDTDFLRRQGVSVGEVAGSCFCCDFGGLIREAENLRHSVHADALIAEPVGSCTDLSATILQPLKRNFRDTFHVAPLTALADPVRLAGVLSDDPGGLHPGAAYIYWKQLEEADVVAVNKSDTIDDKEAARLKDLLKNRLPRHEARFISASRGDGVAAWLDHVLRGDEGGTRMIEVDYDIYADGEAALGWLNATYDLRRTGRASDWDIVALDVMGRIGLALAEDRANIGHLKMLLAAGEQYLAANITRPGEGPSVHGSISGKPERVTLTINARVEMEPGPLRAVVDAAVADAAGAGIVATPSHVHALKPGRPAPTHRFTEITAGVTPDPRPVAPSWNRWLSAALLVFLLAYAGVMISKELARDSAVAPTAGHLLSDGVVVFYFHGHFRCDTCDRIERFTQQALTENFGPEMTRGKIAWRSVNTDIAANAHFTRDYQLSTRTIVMVRTRGGADDEWKKLERAWDFVGDARAFKRYIAAEVGAYLGERK